MKKNLKMEYVVAPEVQAPQTVEREFPGEISSGGLPQIHHKSWYDCDMCLGRLHLSEDGHQSINRIVCTHWRDFVCVMDYHEPYPMS